MARMYSGYTSRTSVVICLLILMQGCASTQPESTNRYSDQAALSQIESLTMLPIVDQAGGVDIDLMNHAFNKLSLELALKGYVFQKADRFSTEREFAPRDIINMKVDQLSELGPPGSDYLLICFLYRLDKDQSVLADSAQAKVSAVIIDKKHKRKIWENTGQGYSLKSLMGSGLMVKLLVKEEYEAVSSSLKQLLAKLPERAMD